MIYFADDDNTYDERIFSEIFIGTRGKKVSMFPVGLLRPAGIRSPVVQDGKIVGFVEDLKKRGKSLAVNAKGRSFRRYPIDMAGFAFTVKTLHSSRPKMPFRATWEEEEFLRSMQLSLSDITPLADNCTRILVWHTMTAAPDPVPLSPTNHKLNTNLPSIAREMIRSGIAIEDNENGSEFVINFPQD